MATISVEREHGLSKQEALERAHELVEKFAGQLNAQVSWDGSEASFKGKGFNGGARVTAETISVDVDLALLLRPLKSTIAQKLETALDQNFA